MELNKSQKDFIDFATDTTYPNLLYRGLLSVPDINNLKGPKVPLYLCEILEEDNEKRVVTVYEPMSKDMPWKKKSVTHRVKSGPKGNTKLAVLASKMIKPTYTISEEENPPLFLAPLVHGKDTFSGQYGLGFFEREPDRVTYTETGPKIVTGELTGVFINLSSIKWKDPIVPTQEVIKRTEANKLLWLS